MAVKNAGFAVQERFIEHLRRMAGNRSLAEEMAEVLSISTDSAYRRIRCETAITVDEVVTLCKHFRLSPEILTEKVPGRVTFTYKSLVSSSIDIDAYLSSIISDLENALSFENSHLYFAAEDVPVFHHLDYPALTPFKFFYWRKSTLNDPALHGKKFEVSAIDESTLMLAKKIVQLYNNVPCTEIWTAETISSTLSQIIYYAESGLFKTLNEALDVLNDVRQMIEHLQRQAELNSKFLRGEPEPAINNLFNLYSYEVQIGNNSIFVDSDKLKISLLSFNTFNSLLTFNMSYCNENQQWIQNLIKKSVLISSISEKQRLQFFRNINRLIDAAQIQIERTYL
jgi:hypothetical protein